MDRSASNMDVDTEQDTTTTQGGDHLSAVASVGTTTQNVVLLHHQQQPPPLQQEASSSSSSSSAVGKKRPREVLQGSNGTAHVNNRAASAEDSPDGAIDDGTKESDDPLQIFGNSKGARLALKTLMKSSSGKSKVVVLSRHSNTAKRLAAAAAASSGLGSGSGGGMGGAPSAGPVSLCAVPVPDDAKWRYILRQLPRCSAEEGIRATSYFASGKYAAATSAVSSSSARAQCLRRLLQELVSLEEDLPDTVPGIFVRFDEETPQFLRVLMAAPQGTPYSLGLFCFDLWVPDTYPHAPPKMHLLTTGGGTVRFSPNLYADGKVCLSLLNTWSGPKWNPSHSTILQILLSVQGLILGVQNPYYLEPGHGGWEGHVKSSTISPNPATNTNDKTDEKQSTGSGEVPSVAATMDQAFATGEFVAKPPPPDASGENNILPSASSSDNELRTSKLAPTFATLPSVPVNDAGDTTESTASGNLASAPTASSTTRLMTNMPVVDVNVPSHIHQYEDRLRAGTVKFAMLEMIEQALKDQPRHYLSPFKDIILAHFFHCKDAIEPTITQWAAASKSISSKRQLQGTVTLLSLQLTKLPKPSAVELAEAQQLLAKSSTASNGDTKMPAKDNNESTLQAIISSKRKAMEEAAAQQDYTTAARLQKELASLDQAATTTHCSIEKRISAKTKAMEQAAEAKDYISAGKHQLSLQRLEKNKKLLQSLEARMFDAAGKLDFVRAGRFQEQFQILLQHSDSSADESDNGIVDMPSRYGKVMLSAPSSIPHLVSPSMSVSAAVPTMSVSAAVAKAAASASKLMGGTTKFGKGPLMVDLGSAPPGSMIEDYDYNLFGSDYPEVFDY